MPKNKVYRFAFGSEDNPSSAVWRCVIDTKKGDVYVNCVPELGNNFHFSLHSSGRYSLKSGDKRTKLAAGIQFGNLHLMCVVFFRNFAQPLKTLEATGSLDRIKWLGAPKGANIFAVKLLHLPVEVALPLHMSETNLFGPERIKVRGNDKNFHIVLEERAPSEEEARNFLAKPTENIEFVDGLPENAFYILITQSQGVPAICIEPYSVSLKKQA